MVGLVKKKQNLTALPKGGTPTKYTKFVQKMNVFNIFRVRLPLGGRGAKQLITYLIRLID